MSSTFLDETPDEDNERNYRYRLMCPVEYRLSYWCIGYIEKIGGGHHRHYEFFIWMLRRLNYRAVFGYLAYCFIHGPRRYQRWLRTDSCHSNQIRFKSNRAAVISFERVHRTSVLTFPVLAAADATVASYNFLLFLSFFFYRGSQISHRKMSFT